MRKIWMMVAANIRKSKGQTVGMLILMLMSAMFLYMGLVMYFGVERFFDARAEELNTPHFVTLQNPTAPSNAQLAFIEQFPGVYTTESQGVLVGSGSFLGVDSYYSNGTPNTGLFIIADGTAEQNMNLPVLVGDFLPLEDDSVYIFHTKFIEGGHEIGDKIRLDFMGQELDFIVSGSTEEILFGNYALAAVWRVYVSNERFNQLRAQFPDNYVNMISARMENIDDAVQLFAEYRNEFLGTEYFDERLVGAIPLTHHSIREIGTLIPMLVAMFLTAFSIILLVVGIVVIYVRISNSIEENMTNIGVQKAMGYRDNQIISAILLQFGLIVLIGGVLGIALSQAALPTIARILEPTMGLPWNPPLEPWTAVFSLFAVLFAVLSFSLLSSWRIKKLYPLTALRENISTHSFKKNPVPLDKSRGPLTMMLALKQIVQNKKQSLMIGVIVAAVTFASVSGVTLYYNSNINPDSFTHAVLGEMSDIIVAVNDSNHISIFEERVQAHPGVSRVFGNELVMAIVDDIAHLMWIVDDFSLLTGGSLVEGRFPLHFNEVVMGPVSLELMDKGVGDLVTIRSGNREQNFLVTGVVQSIARGFDPLMGMMNTEGFYRIQPDFAFSEYWIYLEDGVDSSAFMDSLMRLEGDTIAAIISMEDEIEPQVREIGNAFAIVTLIILTVVGAVVVLVLFLVIKTTILRRRREIGLQKALGFTTFQLMNQIALSLTPTILLGVTLGTLGGYFGFNPMMVALMSDMGIVRVEMPTPIAWTVALCFLLVLFSYAVSLLIAWRIRKISAYRLVVE
jgi:putative ABC transport system permease protein